MPEDSSPINREQPGGVMQNYDIRYDESRG